MKSVGRGISPSVKGRSGSSASLASSNRQCYPRHQTAGRLVVTASQSTTHRIYIGGQWVDSVSGRTYQ
ncbi:MAG: hypothetical protein O7E55_06175, partial [Chloroflexi bacterium]|nr:hypothetical protein [Chloroflexota bacterium]